MKLEIDTEKKTLVIDGKNVHPLYSKESFETLSKQWLKVGWNEKYTYTFSWLGRPIIQLPDDMIRLQEVIYQIKPDVILETGIAHGGSLIYSASLCKAIGKGRVIGVDIEIRPHNRSAIEAHELFPLISLFEGSSVDPKIVSSIKNSIMPSEKVMVILDSNHTKEHVLKELKAYAPLVGLGSYIVVTDGYMKELTDTPRGAKNWDKCNPYEASLEFLEEHSEFKLETPKWPFNESQLSENVTHWPAAWLKRVS